MSQVRNVSGNDRYVPALGCTVNADEVVDVPDELLEGLTCQDGVWEDVAAPKPKKKAAKKTAAAPGADVTDPPAEPTTADADNTEDSA